ncbi:substrate-binding domain-containing protein [Treponema sp. Marseille-Q4132]|uniref:substrate-binding domain-containing protein n=1 Tax=Treponema sp. Marseille-Q4132 TaxID=2766701 RepID=UPI001652CB2C|nr:substrate-binding domain-containing protein [Treponema sp. Marseille-Q4132]QNL97684.1 substrate-binding domain-containing protein [Treponema sp. Marseille-Q4132]
MNKVMSAAVLSVLLLGGCTKQMGMKQSAMKKGEIGLAVSAQNAFFSALIQGAEQEAKTQGVKLTVADAGDSAAKQASDIKDFISKKVSVIIVNPVDSAGIAPSVAAAKKAGITVISLDRSVIGESVASQIASDNVAGGKIAGSYLLKLVGENADIAELQGSQGTSAATDRGKGFHEAVDGKANVVASVTANFKREEGRIATENILRANPNVKGIFAHNDEMALGAVDAVSAAGKDIVIVGFDAIDDALAAVKEGRMAATVAQMPAKMGKTAVQTAVKLMNGEKVASSIPVSVMLITK